jgi:CBS domain containing-hemolysin-like protein
MAGELVLVFVFLVFSAFFSLSETAITRVSKYDLSRLLDKKVRGSKILNELHKHLLRTITTILIGDNLVNIGAAITATSFTYDLANRMGWHSEALFLSVVTGIMTLVTLIFGDIIPKNFAISYTHRMALIVSPVIWVVSIILLPLILALNFVSSIFIRLLGGRPFEQEALITADEFKGIISMSEKEGILEKDETAMMHSIFEFGEIIAKEIYTPRSEIVSIEMKSSVDDVLKVVNTEGHSRIPVYNGKLDNVIGIIYAKDVLRWLYDKKAPKLENLSSLVRPVNFVPETKNVNEIFQQMRVFKYHIAITVDKKGHVTGLLTLEDILEQIVGEIHDEFEKDIEKNVVPVDASTIIAHASLSLEVINKTLGTNLPEGEFSNLNLFLTHLAGRIPSTGDILRFEQVQFKIEEVRHHRVIKVRIAHQPPTDYNLIP